MSKVAVAKLAKEEEDALERENEIESNQEMPDAGRKGIARRRYELMRDDGVDSGLLAQKPGFMSRLVE